jgi:hypothetical protein
MVAQGLAKKKARSCAMALSVAQSDEELVAAWRASDPRLLNLGVPRKGRGR